MTDGGWVQTGSKAIPESSDRCTGSQGLDTDPTWPDRCWPPPVKVKRLQVVTGDQLGYPGSRVDDDGSGW